MTRLPLCPFILPDWFLAAIIVVALVAVGGWVLVRLEAIHRQGPGGRR